MCTEMFKAFTARELLQSKLLEASTYTPRPQTLDEASRNAGGTSETFSTRTRLNRRSLGNSGYKNLS